MILLFSDTFYFLSLEVVHMKKKSQYVKAMVKHVMMRIIDTFVYSVIFQPIKKRRFYDLTSSGNIILVWQRLMNLNH